MWKQNHRCVQSVGGFQRFGPSESVRAETQLQQQCKHHKSCYLLYCIDVLIALIDRGWAAVTWKCHSALHAWTPGVTWSVTWCYLECYLVLPGRCLALPGFFILEFFFVVPKYPRFSNSNFWKKINFHPEMLPGPTPVVVTCLPGPPSAHRFPREKTRDQESSRTRL